MPNVESHAPGSFNWFELATNDQAAAKEFYGELFGWEAFDAPMGPDSFYTMFSLEGRNSAAAYTMRAEMQAQGVPPHWDIYIAVEGADQTAAKITEFGGKLIASPFDLLPYGRMAVAADPTGAVFCIWQTKSHPGTGITGVDGTVCWADLYTTDVEAASKFYTAVFGWKIEATPGDPSDYLHIQNGETYIGGMPPAKHLQPGVPPNWVLYFLTSDIEATHNKAGALGGRTLLPLMELPGTGRFSMVSDPQGAAFALFQAAPRG